MDEGRFTRKILNSSFVGVTSECQCGGMLFYVSTYQIDVLVFGDQMGSCTLIGPAMEKKEINLSCLQVDEYTTPLKRHLMNRLLFVSENAFIAILSTNEIKLVKFAIQGGTFECAIQSIYIVDHAMGQISQKGHYFVDPARNQLYAITSTGTVSQQDVYDPYPSVFYANMQQPVWKIVEVVDETMIFIPESRCAVCYFDYVQQTTTDILQIVRVIVIDILKLLHVVIQSFSHSLFTA